MGRIPWYVMCELIKVFVVALFAMTALVMLGGVAQEAVRQGLGPAPILRLMPYLLPEAMRFAVPATVLFSACSVYGRMAANNEVVALKSLGISPLAVLTPALIFSFLLSLSAVWLNDLAATWGRSGVHRVVLQSVEEIAYGMLTTQRTYGTNRFSINVKRVDGRKLVRPTLVFYAQGKSPQVTVTAAEAELRTDPIHNELSILLTNGTIDVGDEITAAFPDTIERVVPLTDASRKGAMGRGAGELALAEIPAEVDRHVAKIAELEQQLAAQAALFMLSGELHQLNEHEWVRLRGELAHTRINRFRLQVEPWRRWANGFSCFCFMMVGAPLAMRMRNSDLWTTFGMTFIPVLLVYYPLLIYGSDQAKNGDLPSICTWLGNFLLGIWGLWELRNAVKN